MLDVFGGPRQTKTVHYPIVFNSLIIHRKIQDTKQDTRFKCCFFDQSNFLVPFYSPTSSNGITIIFLILISSTEGLK